jgi:hypothetical protein
LTATIENGAPMINGAGLVATDIDASNGVIHVIDSVMLPPAVRSTQATQAAPKYVTHACPTTGRVTRTMVRPNSRH